MTVTDNDEVSEEESQLFRNQMQMQDVTPLDAPAAGRRARRARRGRWARASQFPNAPVAGPQGPQGRVQLRGKTRKLTPVAGPQGPRGRGAAPASRRTPVRGRSAPEPLSRELLAPPAGRNRACQQVRGDTQLRYRRHEVHPREFDRLRRGKLPREVCLDLHGQSDSEARRSLYRFLADCQERGARCVLLVHGKGRGSQQSPPVLKNMVNTRLRQRPEVLAFCSAQARHGGTGALYILLRAPATE